MCRGEGGEYEQLSKNKQKKNITFFISDKKTNPLVVLYSVSTRWRASPCSVFFVHFLVYVIYMVN